MEVFDAVRTVLAVRTYQDKPVPPVIIRQIVEAGRLTGSSMNQQPWHFIVVENKDTIKKLAKRKWAEAPLMIVGLADRETAPKWCDNDLGIALEHIVLAATNLGLGTCWMGQTGREEMIINLLGIPDNFKVIAVIPVGVPDEIPVPKERKSLEAIVSWEKFGSKAL